MTDDTTLKINKETMELLLYCFDEKNPSVPNQDLKKVKEYILNVFNPYFLK
jgi:hypothetical protein